MRRVCFFVWICLTVLFFRGQAYAHFGMVIPSDSMVMQGENRTIKIRISFSHPFEGQGMEMTKPKRFCVIANGKEKNLLEALKETKGRAIGLLKAIKEIQKFEGLMGTITMDEFGDAVRTYFIQRAENGEFVTASSIDP